jgi:hypothetical protein
MGLFREFFLIVAGGFIGSALGAGFGALVGWVFPDFVVGLWRPDPVDSPARVGGGMGMVSGLLIGSTAMVAGRFLGAIRLWAGNRDG